MTSQEATALYNKLRQCANVLVDSGISDENKLSTAQQISENFEGIVHTPHYSTFLDFAIPKLLQVLRDGEPQFQAENPVQELRKLLFEIIHRIPTNDFFKPHVKSVLTVVFRLLEVENEENVLVCLRIIIELHKQYRPQIQPEIQTFIQFVKHIYKELPVNAKTYFEVVSVTATGLLPSDNGSNGAVPTRPETPKNVPGSSPTAESPGKPQTPASIPKAVSSLKVLAELPVIVVLLYQLYKQNVHNAIAEFIPLIMTTIALQPSLSARKSPSFNKEAYVDFSAAQVKTVSFLAYVVSIFQEHVAVRAQGMVGGMLGLLRYCPQEVAHLRRELLIAARHILATDLRTKFVPYIDQLFDKDVLVGTGWTVNESLRPLAYSTLADFVHRVRAMLSLSNLATAVHLFSKNVHDESLPISIQRMSCKLLLNLVECIRQKSEDLGGGRDILMKMLEVFVRKFQTIAKHHIPAILEKCQPSSTEPQKSQEISIEAETKKTSQGPAKDNLSIADYREMVKTLVCGMKTITWGAGSCKLPGDVTIPIYPQGSKVFLPSETQIFIRLLKYALQALDVYQISPNATGTGYIRMSNAPHQVRMKEEKENLEHFAGVFTMLNTATFKEVLTATIEYLVERIHNNYALQIVPNSFLANPNTSATFATILVKFLLGRLEDMGTKSEKSNLYLKLFKLVFGSVSLFAQDNEQMLKPHLHEIVNRSMELAMTAKEPYNYFLLLRALFRSIGGGNHDLLYQEFLPLLPNLLQGLNNLQSGIHKQHMKDLFVELCLTVPVRLSSLLPYLPMLMDPLVSALNGSQTLISQGLRTLELCVDNLQPDFLYDHIQPVRADLMQALWRTLRNPAENIAQVAFRVLGKFGGGSRRLLKEPQKLSYLQNENIGPCVSIMFIGHSENVDFPVSNVIEKAVAVLKTHFPTPQNSTLQQSSVPLDNSIFYQRQSWEVVKHFMSAALSLEDCSSVMTQLFVSDAFRSATTLQTNKSSLLPVKDEQSRQTFQMALSGILFASSIKDLQDEALLFLSNVLRQFTFIILAQQAGPFCCKDQTGELGLDAYVIVDAIADVMVHEDKDLCKYSEIAIAILYETASLVLRDRYKAAQLPFFEYLTEKLCNCCYEKAWFAKSGGCHAIQFLINQMPLHWLLKHQSAFISALMFVIMDLANEVSSGAVEYAKTILESLLRKCNTKVDDADIAATQVLVFPSVLQHMVREVVSPNKGVREQARYSLQVLSEVTGTSIHDLMEPYKAPLEDMIPPKKHLLRHQPVSTQIALMDGNAFCTSMSPRLFTMDLNIMEHKVFFTELFSFCDADDAALMKLPCYKNTPSLTEVRVSALAALTSCHYIVQARERIFNVLVKAINSSDPDVMEAGKANMKKFIDGGGVESVQDKVPVSIRPLLLMLGDFRSLSQSVLQKLTCFMELFPALFNEKLCDQLLAHLRCWIDTAIQSTTSQNHVKLTLRNSEDIKICSSIMNMFHLVPAATSKLIDPLVKLTLKTERVLVLEVASPFRDPLVKFLVRYPVPTMDFFLANLVDPFINRLFVYILNRDDAKPIRAALESNPLKLASSTFTVNLTQPTTSDEQLTNAKRKRELQFQGVVIVRTLVKHNDAWLSQNSVLITHLRKIWNSETLFENGNKSDITASPHYWREPKLLAKCLLNYIRHNPDETKLLFHLLRVFSTRCIPSFNFLKRYIEIDVVENCSIDERRGLFFKFVECFHDSIYSQDLIAMILKHVIIPIFQHSFKNGKVDEIIGGPAEPEQDSNENIVSVFINKIIDPDHPFATSDPVRILLLLLSAMFVEYAAPHIHDASNKRQGNKLRRLYIYAWPCLLPKQCVDPATKYHGYYLQAHIIAKFAIHKKFVLQVFHGLLKAHAQEARAIVRQALDILTPVMPHRMEDGNAMLCHWTKKIIVEEGHALAQLVHMLQLTVRHQDVYYPVRSELVQHMVNAMQRLFTTSATADHRKLAVDLAEVIIEWERKRSTEEGLRPTIEANFKRLAIETTDDGPVSKRSKGVNQGSKPTTNDKPSTIGEANTASTPIEKHQSDTVVNFLFRIACQVVDSSSSNSALGEALSRRCVKLLKLSLKPENWPDADLRVSWLEKLFLMVDQTQASNYTNVCTGLEILTYICTVLCKQDAIPVFKPLQRGIVSCIACQNVKVVKAVHSLLMQLLKLCPVDFSGQNKHDELDHLNSSIAKAIFDGLTAYERATAPTTQVLYGPLMLLKAACESNPAYLDKFMVDCLKALQRMQKDHITGQSGDAAVLTEMIIMTLELTKNRMASIHGELRKLFLTILTTLIEKSPDAKLLKAITKIVDGWMKMKTTPQTQQQVPSIREKSLLLYRMVINFEKRFSDDLELHAHFLEIVNFVYRDESLAASELTARLEPAFLAGLRNVQPHIRIKFMEVFDRSVKRRLFSRFKYIFVNQNWEHMGNYFWIKQCLELLLSVVDGKQRVQCSSMCSRLSSVASILRRSKNKDACSILSALVVVKQEPGVTEENQMEVDTDETKKTDKLAYFYQATCGADILKLYIDTIIPRDAFSSDDRHVKDVINGHVDFLRGLEALSVGPFLSAVCQLSHRSTLLAHKTWVDLFPRIWSLLDMKHNEVLCGEMGPFLCNSGHLNQTDCYRSSVNTIVEGLMTCDPPIPLRPVVLKYLGKTHNLWHRATLMLEDAYFACEEMLDINPQLTSQQPWLDFGLYDDTVSEMPVQETFDALIEMYSLLSEDDMWTGLWQRKCRFPETALAVAHENQGLYEQAQLLYEGAMGKARDQSNSGRADPRLLSEYQMWEEHWIRCAKELGQWDILMEFGKTKGHSNALVVLESSWRVPDWQAMKEALAQVEPVYAESMSFRLPLYRGYLAICSTDEQHLSQVDSLVEKATSQGIRHWRKLPAIVSSMHTPLLITAQQIMELQEASQIHNGLQPLNIGRVASVHDMKAIVKTWRNRLPLQSDSLVTWSDIFMWRHHHYQAIVAAYENLSNQLQETQSSNHAMLGVHASAWSIIYYGYVARKHGLTGVCLDSLSRIHIIPSVPIVDCFQKIRQQVKCYLQMAGVMGKQELQEGLNVIESTNLRYFSKEMTAEFFALKGMFLAQVDRSEDANRAFSEAVQMHDTLVKAWALWGDYLDTLFVADRKITLGVYAIVCYMHACRSQNESKCRKYLARALWLLTYDDDKGTLAEALEKYCVGVPPTHWLPWIPQLFTCFAGKEGNRVLNLIVAVGRVFPQAVYFPIRTLYLTLKIEQREKLKMEQLAGLNQKSKEKAAKEKNSVTEGEKMVNGHSTTTESNESEGQTEKSVDNKVTISATASKDTVTTATISEIATTATTTPNETVATISAAVVASDVAAAVKATTAVASSSTPVTNVTIPAVATTTTTSSADATQVATANATTASTTNTTATNTKTGTDAGLVRAPAQMWRCSRIMHMLRDMHPTLLSAIEGIVDQMVWFRECWHEEVLRQLRQGLAKCYQVAFEHRGQVNEAQVSPRTLSFVKKLVSTFGIGFEAASSASQPCSSAASESLARRAQATAQDPVFQKLKGQFTADFDFSQPGSMKLHSLIAKLKKWIKILEAKTKLLPSSFLLEEKCRFLSNFSQSTAEVELPGEFLMPKTTTHSTFYVRIAKFMPKVELVQRHNCSARRLTIRGHNGKLYPYLVINDAWLTESRREERVLQLLRMFNYFLEKRKETCRRALQFVVPRVVAVSPQMRLVEDNTSIVSLSEIYRERCDKRNIDSEAPIAHYYERLGTLQSRGYTVNHQVLKDILKEAQGNYVSDGLLKEWALYTYPNASEYWTFRRFFTQQMALAGLIEFILHLTRLGPEMVNIARDSGHVTFNYFRFDVDESKGELDANRPVPFRLTPNLCELMTPMGVTGVVTHCMVAVARCFVQPQFSIASYLRAVLKDEIIAVHRKKHDDGSSLPSHHSSTKEVDNEMLITMVTQATTAIMTRLQNLAQFENAETKVSTLVAAAVSPDNLCRMDPAWHPWM